MISDYFKIAGRNLLKKRVRSSLTLIGILIAVATIFVLISVSLGLQGAVEELFRQFGTDKFFIEPRGQLAGPGTGGAVQFTLEDVEVIEKTPGVKDFSYWVGSTGKVEFNDEIRYTFVIGIPLDHSSVFIESGFYKAEDGRLLEEGDSNEIMIGNQYKNGVFFTKQVRPLNKLLVNEKEFKVKSILKTVGNPFDDRLIFMPLDNFRILFPETKERIDQIAVQVNENEDINEVAERVQRRLSKFRNVDEENRDFNINTPEEILSSFGSVLNVLTTFLLSVAAISLLVGGIGIANTMFTSVLERTREIGVMKAIGAKNKDILSIFLVEAGILGLIGGIIGILLGIGVSNLIEYIAVNQLGTTLLKAATPIYLLVGCMAFAFFVGIISGFWPAYRALKVKPVEALRYE
ncbi:MAG: ABC transporter permease [Nanoarchaeota archaeon]|nr:ABC transporter permease [Nanoarchaeota archaeon]